MSSQLDHLDRIAARLRGSTDANDKGFWPLSHGERLYVALAADRHDLLRECDYTIAQALVRIGEEWTHELTLRWQYGTPKHAR